MWLYIFNGKWYNGAINKSEFVERIMDMKKIIAIIVAFVCLMGLCSCGNANMVLSIPEATSVYIKSGLTGDEVILADKEFVDAITGNINALNFEKKGAVEGDGYAYILEWYDANNNTVASLTIADENGYQIIFDGSYYIVNADVPINTDLIADHLAIALESRPE